MTRGSPSQHLPEHRAQRRDASAAGNEQDVPLGRRGAAGRTNRMALRLGPCAGYDAFEMRIGRGVIVGLDEQLERRGTRCAQCGEQAIEYGRRTMPSARPAYTA